MKSYVGENNPRAKLTEKQAWEIYQIAWYSGLSQKEIGQIYGVSAALVSGIKCGYSWGFEVPFPDKLIKEQ